MTKMRTRGCGFSFEILLVGVLYDTTGNFPIPGTRISRVAARVDELADRGDQRSCNSESENGILFGLTFQVVDKIVHGLLLILVVFLLQDMFYPREVFTRLRKR